MRFLAVMMLVAACGDPTENPVHDAPMVDSKPIDAAIDSPTVIGPRGPRSFDLPGVAYGAAWDDAASTLYVTDDPNHRLLKWTDANGVQPFGAFTPTSTVLGAIVQLTDKSFYVPNLGQGTTGNIFTMSADGSTNGAIGGTLAVARRRVGITLGPTGTLYETFFTGNMAGSQTGGVASVDPTTGAETDITSNVAGGLKKVTGIVASATTLFVCDQTANKIYAIAIADGATTTLASLPSCDLIYKMPNGDLVTGGITGGVYRITPAGVVSTIRSGFEQIRGIAYDPTMKRMFVVEHRATMATKPLLHVFPLDN